MVDFVGLASVSDRTLFTGRGPIAKRPVPVLTGTDLRVVSPSEVLIASGNFSQEDVGRLLSVSGSQDGRNDGVFPIEEVLSPVSLRLGLSSFSVLDEDATVSSVVDLANDLRSQYEQHRFRKVLILGTLSGVHGTDDGTNVVTVPGAADLPSAISLANDLLDKLNAHLQDVSGTPSVHLLADSADLVGLSSSSSLSQVVLLLNAIRRAYESHRQDQLVHQHADLVDRVSVPAVRPTVGTYPGPTTGPFTWTVLDPLYGQPADSPYDVDVTVNGFPAQVDAVFGLLGAVVLSSRPSGSDSVLISYDYMDEPPARFMRLNTPEFVLNQGGSTSVAGFLKHRYASSSHLISDVPGPVWSSPFQPIRRGWKYKAFERAYTSALNDGSLLLNVPSNRTSYPVLSERAFEGTIRYTPSTLPQEAQDAWVSEGQGMLTLSPDGSSLTVVDSSTQTGTSSLPPFFSHALDLDAESIVSAAFRVRMSPDPSVLSPDGAFCGVSFGFLDGSKAVIAGLLLTGATNLGSAIVLANSVLKSLNGHVVNTGSHFPDDTPDSVDLNEAFDLPSLVVLLNSVRDAYSDHVAKGGGVGLVHLAPDSVNLVSSPPATDVESAISLVNELRVLLNAHGTQVGVHFTPDPSHQSPLVRQVGILTDRGLPESSLSWSSAAVDWSEYVTYRVHRPPGGDVSLFLGGALSLVLGAADLPDSSSVDARFDLLRQAFFGTIGRASKSSSDWQLVLVDVQPVDADLSGGNRRIEYDATVVPEVADPPWIAYGLGGSERIVSSSLLVDSTCSSPQSETQQLGLVPGPYRGFVRYEPTLSPDNSLVVEFSMSADFWTSGVNDRAIGLFMTDPDFSFQIAFLQASPVPATTVGNTSDPYVLVSGDTLVVQVGDGSPKSVTFVIPPGLNTVASVCARINDVLGFPFASPALGRLRLSSPDSGSRASFSILSGSALAKLGLSPGKYFGSDSSPEPKMSWFGANIPELDDPKWVRSGGQGASLLNRVLRVLDASTTDYVAWTLEDPLVTSQVLSPASDWKMSARLAVLSFVAGQVVPSSPPYQDLAFSGALVSVDEGPSGRNVELQLSVDSAGSGFINLLSYDPSSGSLLVVSQYAFAWDDGLPHTFDVYTVKSADSIMVLADGVPLSPSAGSAPSYSGLGPGVAGPSLSFGSGGEPVSGFDLSSGLSVVDWYSVCAFRDAKVSDPGSSLLRYVGVYGGGRTDVLGSYYLHQIDWSVPHTYRVLRDPPTGLQVYVDGSPVPAISVPYDLLRLPPAFTSFLSTVSGGQPVVAFGSFSPTEVSRTRWSFVRYSVGKVTLTSLLVPPRQVLNQANVIASPDHLRTGERHEHQGFGVYSGGTPIDEFMADGDVSPVTVLGPGTPPVPATQNLENRHGMVKVATPLDAIPAVDAVFFPGFAANLLDDDVNVAEDASIPASSALAALILLLNSLRSAYELHRVRPGVHFLDDVLDPVTVPDAADLPSSLLLANDLKTVFNSHLVRPSVHVPQDNVDTVSADDAVDLPSACLLATAILDSYSSHIGFGAYHKAPDTLDEVTAPDAVDLISASLLASSLADSLSSHALSLSFHSFSDQSNGRFAPPVLPGVGRAGVIGLSSLVTPESLDVGQLVMFLDGPNVGQPRTILSRLSASEYQVIPGFVFNDPGKSRYVRMGRSSLTEAIASSSLGFSSIEVTGSPVSPSIGDQIVFLSGPNSGQPRAVVSVSVSGFDVSPVLPVSDTSSWTMALVTGPSAPDVDPLYVLGLVNSLRSRIASHRSLPGLHGTLDVGDATSLPPASTFHESVPLLNELKDDFNSHVVGSRFHVISDPVDAVSAPAAVDPLAASVLTLNSVREAFLSHVRQPGVHLQDDDVGPPFPPPALDLPSAIVLANSLKARFNFHRTAVVHEVVGSPVQRVHSSDDTANEVSLPDAVDLDTLCDLSGQIASCYNSHRTQPGVHGSTLLVRLEAPSRVLYEGIRFWISEVGDDLAKTATFSDGRPSVSSPLTLSGPTFYTFVGDVLPEDAVLAQVISLANNLKASINYHMTAVGVHVVEDLVNTILSPDASDLGTAEALLSEIKEKFVLHLSQAGVHVENDTFDVVVAPDPTALPMASAISSEIKARYDVHRLSGLYHLEQDVINSVQAPDPQPFGWVLVSSDPSAVSVSLASSPEDAVNITTFAPGSTATYRMRYGLPDVRSSRLDFSVRLRIDSFAYAPDVDTGVYAGFLSGAGPGMAAAIGFDALGNVPYVKVQDVRSGEALIRVPFDWADGQFHTYRITRDPSSDSLSLSIDDPVVP